MFVVKRHPIDFDFKRNLLILVMMICLSSLTACTIIPGDTNQDQTQTIDELVERTLADLYKQSPEARAEIENSVGYAIMNNKITKIPMFGAGSGYGVAINNSNQQRQYLQMLRFDYGAGWGVRSIRPIVIFTNEQVFNDFIKGDWSVHFGGEAAAKVGDVGAAGASGNLRNDQGYISYMITDKGVSATFTTGIIRVRPISLRR